VVLRVETDREICIGSENCNRYAPNTFETDAEGKVVVKSVDVDPESAIRVAVAGCPVGALSIGDD
jgi:ferredoxin